MKKNVVRLAHVLQPENYQLKLELNPDAMSFKGTVTLRAKRSGRPSRRITLHQKDLKIQSATVIKHDKKGDEEIVIDRINTHAAFDEVRLHSKSMLYPGTYTITIAFSGNISRAMNGLYPSTFTHDDKNKVLLATQFESHHAREVFPCIDEPEAKATFDLTLLTPDKNETILANTPVNKQETKNHMLETSFETTPVMSTYLLAFVVGELGFIEAKTSTGTTVRAYATPDNVAHLKFALDVAVKCLEFYEDYFGIPYPLAKCDMVALPDFASGAMENWGLITYREQALLVDEANTSAHAKQYVAMVVAHELAHMWFGNLVTMRWWTDLWLNEGFASWVEYLAVDQLFPDWGMWTQFIADEQAVGLKLDALEHTHAVEVPIHHPDEIRTIFDAISYQKGSSVIHMLQNYLGAEVFRDGLRHYLKRHMYGNTDTVDLWAALGEISGKPVKEFMHAWTSLPGYPIVSMEAKKNDLQLSQQRFYLNPAHSESKTSLWPVPLLSSVKLAQETFQTSEVKIKHGDTSPLIINKGHRGFYRTTYDSASLNKLATIIPKLDPEDRIGILGDAFEAAKAGYGSTTDVLALLPAYKHEQNASVWDIISSNIGELRRVMNDDVVRDKLKPYVQSLVTSELKRLGWDEQKSDSYFDTLLRPTILAMAASSDHAPTLKEIDTRYKSMKQSEDIRPDIRGVVYTTIARLGDATDFDRLLKLHNQTTSSEERITLAAALTNFKQPELINKSLELIASDTVRLQDAAYWLSYSFANRFAKDATWQWVKDHWDWMQKNLGNDLSFYRTPVYVARSFSDSSFKQEYEAFFLPKMSPGLDRSIKQGLEILDWQAAWRTRDLKSITEFLN
jgi:aminopeptidase N